MDTHRDKSQTSTATWIIVIIILVAIATAVGVSIGSHKQGQSTTEPDQTTSTTDNLKLQNECIANAQATDESNPIYYSTLAIGDQPAGWTLAGQEQLQTQTADCKSQYPTN